jgi:hypothetical protein
MTQAHKVANEEHVNAISKLKGSEAELKRSEAEWQRSEAELKEMTAGRCTRPNNSYSRIKTCRKDWSEPRAAMQVCFHSFLLPFPFPFPFYLPSVTSYTFLGRNWRLQSRTWKPSAKVHATRPSTWAADGKKEINAFNQDIANLKEPNIQIRQEKDRQLQSMEQSYMRRLSEWQEKISSLEDQLSSLREMHKFEGIWRMCFSKEREKGEGKRKMERDNRG